MKNKNSIKLNDEKSVMRFLRESTVKIAEALTRILVSEKQDLKLSAGKIIQAVIKGNLLTQLGREIEKYRNQGKIKEDYFATHRNRALLYELLKFLDEEVPEEELFTAIKSIFFSGISRGVTKHEEVLAYEFLQTAKRLRATEILILKANFEIAQKKTKLEIQNIDTIYVRDVWFTYIAKQMGYEVHTAIVEKYEPNLISLGLISPVTHNDNSGFKATMYFRLTATGYKFCEFITNFEKKIDMI